MKTNKQNFTRTKKRLPPKNRHKRQSEGSVGSSAPPIECSSSRKLIYHSDVVDVENPESYNMLIDIEQMKTLLANICCPECRCTIPLLLTDNLSKRMGYSHYLVLQCETCGWSNSCFTSKLCSDSNRKTTRGRKLFESNLRAVIGFREIGRGKASLKKFSACMNMYSIGETSFDNLNDNSISKAYAKAAQMSMKRAASELCGDIQGPVKKRVKIDGSWQKRGHASLNGSITAVVDDKVVDYQAFSKHCKGCKMWNSKEGTPAYDRWKVDHVCHVNHTKSSGAMEAAGAIEMFSRSVERNNLIYNEYLGDGDTSSFKEVVDSEPYKAFDVVPQKLECIGHVQKRMGTRLRDLVKTHKGTKTSLGGKGKLTKKVIDSMQTFYGIAIRNNCENVYVMKKAVGAILYHCTNFSDPERRHCMCPRDENTWCKWRLAKLKGTKPPKDKISLPLWIHSLLKPIFTALSTDDLLKKCTHGQTQNANEAFNAVIWSRCPKNIFVSRPTFEMAINSAVLHFNDGGEGVKVVLKQFGLGGAVTSEKLKLMDEKRVRQMKRKSTDPVMKQRKKLRKKKKGIEDTETANEKQESYVSGGF